MSRRVSHDTYPSRNEVIDYLARYEDRYHFPVRRPVHVKSVSRAQDGLLVTTDHEESLARAVVSATGTWSAPYVPDYPGRENFRGRQMHSAQYRNPDDLHGQNVLVVGGGNSGAQILAEVSTVCNATWVTLQEPVFSSRRRGWPGLVRTRDSQMAGSARRAHDDGAGRRIGRHRHGGPYTGGACARRSARNASVQPFRYRRRRLERRHAFPRRCRDLVHRVPPRAQTY